MILYVISLLVEIWGNSHMVISIFLVKLKAGSPVECKGMVGHRTELEEYLL